MNIDHLKEALIEPAATLAAVQAMQGKAVREQSMAEFGHMIDAHLIATGLLGAALQAMDGKLKPFDAEATRREGLIATFVIGEPLSMEAILCGQYLQASALVRQEIETLAALHEVAAGRRVDGRTPRVSGLEESMRRLYNRLTDGAHVAHGWIVEQATRAIAPWPDMPPATVATRHYPEFDRELGRRQFALHVYLLLLFAVEANNDASRAFGLDMPEAQLAGFDAVVSLLISEGMMERYDAGETEAH